MIGDKEVGHIYILSNPAMPDFVKIGHTMKKAAERACELSNTSVPLPYRVECEVLVERPRDVERRLHSKLHSLRVSPDREFFKTTASYAEEELNLLLYGERSALAAYPKQIIALVSLKEKYPEYFTNTELSESTKFLLLKSIEDCDPSARSKARAMAPSYEEFMGKFEDRNKPLTFAEACEKIFNPIKKWK